MQEKRAHRRVSINIPVAVERKQGAALGGVAKDVSIGGMFIEVEAALQYGEEITIVVDLPGTEEQSRLPAVVRWTRQPGFGAQFGLLGARDTRAIVRLLESG